MKLKELYDAIYIRENDINNIEIVEKYVTYAIDKYVNLIFEINTMTSMKLIIDILEKNNKYTDKIYCICIENNKIYLDYANEMFYREYEYNESYLEEKLHIKNMLQINFLDHNKEEKTSLVPVISSKETEKEEYILNLAQYYQSIKGKSKREEEKVVNKFNNVHSFTICSFEEIYDKKLGAVIVEDSEVVILKNCKKMHPLIKIFEIDCLKNKLRYSCNQNKDIILRGPENYYYNMCYLAEYNSKELKNIIFKINTFLKNTVEVLRKENINPNKEILDLKLVLALYDILRNITTCSIYYCIREEITDQSSMLAYNFLNETKSNLTKLYTLLKTIFSNIYDVLFSENYKFNINEFIKILEIEIEMQSELLEEVKKEKNINYRKSLRLWRETDNIIENIVTFNSVIREMDTKILGNKKILILGLNYGSVDLAILASIIYEKIHNKKAEAGEIIVNLTYPEIYDSDLLDFKIENTFNMDFHILREEYECIIVDDNIVSGKSLQAAINLASRCIKTPLFNIVIRYPGINRVNQMYNKTNDCQVNIKLFSKYIKGLFYPTYFTKLNATDNMQSYFNRLNIFDSCKDELEESLFKNNLFIKNSHIYNKYKSFIVNEK